MSADQKQKGHKQKKEKKYTALGEDIDVVKKRQDDAKLERKKMIENIEDVVANGNDYVTKNFFIAHVNHYCYCNAQNRHIPAEISIIRFTLKNGVAFDDIYHAILDTGNLPIGYRLAATTVSEESHMIPIPPHEDDMAKISEKDIQKAYLSMIEYFRKTVGRDERLPPVYVDDSNIEMSKDIFKNLYDQYDANNVYNQIQVYTLSYLFYVLRNAARSRVSTVKAFPFPTIPQTELEKDVYDYAKGIACKYHTSAGDSYPHCTLSKCIRKAYIICDHTCGDLNIKLIPGLHIPQKSRKQKLEERSASQNGLKPVADNSGPSSSVPNEVFSSASANSNTVETVAQNVAGNSVQCAATGRKPLTLSKVMIFGRNQAPDLENDFPALGNPKPVSLGRGRGRVQTVKPNNGKSK